MQLQLNQSVRKSQRMKSNFQYWLKVCKSQKQIFLKLHFFRTCNVLPFSCTNYFVSKAKISKVDTKEKVDTKFFRQWSFKKNAFEIY